MQIIEELLDPTHITLFDGAMGTMLYSKGVFINQSYDELNMRAPEMVRSVHDAYVAAGAEVLETNTFGANRIKLATYGLESRCEEINARAAAIARESAGTRAAVAGAVGPLGIRLEPYGPTSVDEARAVFAEQIAALANGGVDCLVLETFADLREIEQALRAAREVAPGLPVIAQMTLGADGATPFGTAPEEMARSLDAWGADVIGLNCSVGPQMMLEAVERMAPVTRRKLSAMPNAGLPREIGGRRIYMASPEYMATYARHLVHAGARVIGGCCGTGPEHIRSMAEGLRGLQPRTARATVVAAAEPRASAAESQAAVQPVPMAARSNWGARLACGEFVTTVEIVPPRGADPTPLIAQADALKQAGVDAVNIPDGPRAQSRIGAMMASLIVQQRGLEAVAHYTCRDRNLLGMLSDLLGAAALGVRNLLLITGDPPKMGPFPNATGVFDVDSIGLTNLVRNLNRGLDPGGNAIGEPTRFVIGVGVNPGAIDLEHEIRRFEWKVDAGAEFAITQPVFDVGQLERFLERIAHVRIPIVAGIWPLVSARNAEFLANEVPGIVVPRPVLERMARAQARSREDALAEGVAIAREMLASVRGCVQGVQVSAPLGRLELALEVLRDGRVVPSTERASRGSAS